MSRPPAAPSDPEPDSYAAACIDFAEAVRADGHIRPAQQFSFNGFADFET